MPFTEEQINIEVVRLRASLADQAARVLELVERAFASVYDRDAAAGRAVVELDDVIDKADISIEQHAVDLLVRTAKEETTVSAELIREVLVAVKVNNDLELIADAGVAVAELVVQLTDRETRFPDTLRVMTNSVIGLLRDTGRCYAQSDPELAKVVLHSDDAVDQFRVAIMRDAEERVASGWMGVDLAFDLHEIAIHSLSIADHCTNIAEQVIFATTGAVLRHNDGKWCEVPRIGG
jgi:phosphate transport system protein